MTTRLRHGDQLALDDPRVLGLYSCDLCEDGETMLALYDLAGGATGCASWQWRDAPGAGRVLTVVMEAER